MTTNFSLIATGSKAQLFSMTAPASSEYMGSFVSVKGLMREHLESTEPQGNDWSWDCDCGVAIYGATQAVEAAYERLQAFMLQQLDDKIFEHDLAHKDSPRSFILFKSTIQDIAVIVGGGYYVETEEKLLELLDKLEQVEYFELGANYSDDDDFFTTLAEATDYQLRENKTEDISQETLSLLKEMLAYRLKTDIEEREYLKDRFSELCKTLF